MRIRLLVVVACVSLACQPVMADTANCRAGGGGLSAEASIAAVKEQCRPGDAISFTRPAEVCEGVRCTETSVSRMCDPRFPIHLGAYRVTICIMAGPPAKPRPAAPPARPKFQS